MLKMNFSCLTESAELLFRARYPIPSADDHRISPRGPCAPPCLSPPRFAPLDEREVSLISFAAGRHHYFILKSYLIISFSRRDCNAERASSKLSLSAMLSPDLSTHGWAKSGPLV